MASSDCLWIFSEHPGHLIYGTDNYIWDGVCAVHALYFFSPEKKRRWFVFWCQNWCDLAIGTVFVLFPRLNFILYLAKAVVDARFILDVIVHQSSPWHQ